MIQITPGTVIGEHFRIGKKLGPGGTGNVYLADIIPDPRYKVAIKLAFTDNDGPANEDKLLEREAELLQTWDWRHPGIVRLFPIPFRGNIMYTLRANEIKGGPYYMIMEYLGGGTLSEWLPRIHNYPLDWKLELFYQIATTISYMHQKGYGHRDLKPENILFRKQLTPNEMPQIVLVDFALASDGRDMTELISKSYTLQYAAPERILRAMGTEVGPFMPKSEDIWSLGIILYEIVTGQLAFQGNRQQVTATLIGGNIESFLLRNRPELPGLLATFIRDMLVQAPASRPSIDLIILALEQYFIPPRIQITTT